MPYTGEAVDAAFGIAQAAMVLCTPDEDVLLREDLRNPNEPGEGERAWRASSERLLRGRHRIQNTSGAHDRA